MCLNEERFCRRKILQKEEFAEESLQKREFAGESAAAVQKNNAAAIYGDSGNLHLTKGAFVYLHQEQ